MRIWLLLLFFFPLTLQAQKLLKPGAYSNQKYSEPVVLDTGSCTFKGCAFAPSLWTSENENSKLACEATWDGLVLLDACKAKSLSLIHCQFEGTGKETAILLGMGNLQFSKVEFRNFFIGIEAKEKADLSLDSCLIINFGLAGIVANQVDLTLKNCRFGFEKGYARNKIIKRKMPKYLKMERKEIPYGAFLTGGSLSHVGLNTYSGPYQLEANNSYNNLVGTAIRLANTETNISGALATKWKYGIRFRAWVPNQTGTITANRFYGNATAIDIEPEDGQTITNARLKMTCNRFDHRFIEIRNTTPPEEKYTDFTGNSVGLRVGPGVTISNNRIGGDGQTGTGFEFPNSNYWPRTGAGLNPTAIPNFTSILLENNGLLNYHSYQNEFLGTVDPPIDLSTNLGVGNPILQNNFSVKASDIQTHCTANFNNSDCDFADVPSCVTAITDNPTNNMDCTDGRIWRLACNYGGAFDFVSFPIGRPAPKDTSLQALVKVQETLYGEQPYLGQSIPNPGSGKITIPLFVPLSSKGAKLQVLETATGRKVHEQDLDLGAQFINLQVQTWAAGIYTYQMQLPNGQPPKVQKMVVLH